MKKIVVLLLLLLIFAFGCLGNNEDKSINQIEKYCINKTVPYEEVEYYTETVPYTQQECETKKLAYNVEDFVISKNICIKDKDVCNEYFLGICTDTETFCVKRQATCELKINNLDPEEGGYWNVEISFLDYNTKEVLEKQVVEEYIYPQSHKLFSATVTMESDTPDGEAQVPITCSYKVLDVPTKQVCRDVIKYKEVQKSRTVTKYKVVEECS